MNKKLLFSGILVCLLVFSIGLMGCGDGAGDGDGDGGGGSGGVPTELQGTWVGSVTRTFTKTQLDSGHVYPDNVSVSGSTITVYLGTTTEKEGTATYAISGSTLTISSSTAIYSLPDGTYTKQQ
jgi:hypothetical protein